MEGNVVTWRRGIVGGLSLGLVGLGFVVSRRLAAKQAVEDGIQALLVRASPGAPLPVDLVHPDLLTQADPTQLVRMLAWLTEELGAFQGVALGGFQARERPHGGGVARGGQGDFRFAHGLVSIEAFFLDDKLIHLGVLDPGRAAALAAHLAVPPADLTGYFDRGRDFFARAFGGEPATAYAMLHPGLAKAFGSQAAFEARLRTGAVTGDLDLVEDLGATPDPSHPSKVHLRYRVTTSDGAVLGHLTLQFVALGSHIVGFQIPSHLAGPVG